MASTRPRSSSRNRLGDGPRLKRIGGVMEKSKEELLQTLARNARREAEDTLLLSSTNNQSRASSRIPQNPSARKPSLSSTRPPLTHETRSWGSSIPGSSRSSDNAPSSTNVSSRDQGALSGQTRNFLRRKHSGVSQEVARLRDQSRSNSEKTSSSSSIPSPPTHSDPYTPQLDRCMTASPTDLRIAQRVELPRNMARTTTIYPELDRYHHIEIPRELGRDLPFRLATHDLPPPTPLFSGGSTLSGSSSTRFSESPGPGPYSRDTTPTSMSSASPGVAAPARNTALRVRQASPAEARPPMMRRRADSVPENDAFSDQHGLVAVREALTSSSSNSTVRDGDKKEKKEGAVNLAHPNPPPRKSSQKLKKTRGENESPFKLSRAPAQPLMSPLSPARIPRVSSENSQRPIVSPQLRQTPPSRPSREGTPDIYSQFGGPIPVIHSNLSSTNISNGRQSNQIAPSSLPRSATTSSQDHPTNSRLPTGREATLAPNPSSLVNTQPPKADSGRALRTPSPIVSGFKTKFGLFSRRKPDTEASKAEKKDRPSRKGPAAGTGHEGYGRIGAVRSRSSNATYTVQGLAGPISSTESLASSQSAIDPFLLGRIKPVIIAGGQVIENRNTSSEVSRTESNQSLPLHRGNIDTRNNSSASLSGVGRNTLWPSAFPRNSNHSRRPSDSSDSEAVTMKSTIAFRRSVQRFCSSPDQQPMKLPKPITTRKVGSPSLGDLDTSVLTDDSCTDVNQEHVRGGDIESSAPKKLTKRAKSPRKWSLFGRSQNQPTNSSTSTAKKKKKKDPTTVPAAVESIKSKPVAFYTMMDSSEQEDAEDVNIKDVLREAEVLTPPPSIAKKRERRPSKSSQHIQRPSGQSTAQQAAQLGKFPIVDCESSFQPTPRLTEAKPVVEQEAIKPSVGKASRLPQVGRIPRVINSRSKQAPPMSFSRPFKRTSLQPDPDPVQDGHSSVAQGADLPELSTPELTKDETTGTTTTRSSLSKFPEDALYSSEFGQHERGFLAFPPRKTSDCTTISTSSGSGVPAYANHIAVIPQATAPLAEDEIWDEYNDLLGDVPHSATSSRGIPFDLETCESKLARKSTKPLESPTIKVQTLKGTRDSCGTDMLGTSSSRFSADMTARINAAFHFDGSEQPETPFSISEFVSGYGERNKNDSEVVKIPSSSQRSSSSSRKNAAVRMSNSSSASEETPLSQVNLRVGSMTVSKWLTFGHVLFSPAREELVQVVGSLKRRSILVIDGLGNDDWSFYAAETYPMANFFNLSPRAPLSQEHQSSTSLPLSPANHHQIQYTSHMEKFPFGPDSFTTVVFRFPSAAPEAHYRNIISEARRVLKPGGHVELAVLDVDLNNMGNRSRRAVRRLKERIATKNPNYNLSSTADLMLRLLGRKGFIDVKSCRVGIPVASAVVTSSENEAGRKRKKDERSLAEMMNDETEMGDENITKMVAKVGRWWYSRLYETLSGVSSSIWNEKALLTECEEWGTSLKLMVCHARIPEGRSRVSSV